MLGKLKALITGERQDLRTGEIVDIKRHETPDPTPVAAAIGYKREPSLAEKVRNMVRSEQLRLAAEAAGAETFEEADDFEVGDDYDPRSPYEIDFDPPVEPTQPVPESGGAGGSAPAEAAPAAAPAAPAAPAAS